MFLRLNLRHKESTIFFGPPEWWTEDGARVYHPPLTGKKVCGLIHGYNVKEALGAYREVYENIKTLYDIVVGITWPGSEIALAFWLARIRARKAGRILAQVFAPCQATLDLEAHSLGCMVGLEAAKAGLQVRNLILTAAAVDNESIQFDGEYGSVRAERVTVFYSRHDPVLAKAYRLAMLDNALGRTGPENHNLTPLNVFLYDFSGLVDGHNKYKDLPEFYGAWKELVNADQEG